MERTIWLELVTLGALIWLGYMGARLVGRLNLPSVTGFLLVGVIVGPHGFGLLSLDLLHKIGFVNTLALGLIVFLIGEELTAKMLSRHHWSFWLISALSVVLPAALVIWTVSALRPGEIPTAWVLAAIAMSGAPATLMSVLAETKAKGRSCDMLLGSAAFSDIATVVGYSMVGPLLLLRAGSISTVVSAGGEQLLRLGGGIAVGIVAGVILGWLLQRTREPGELLSLGLTHVLLVVAAAKMLGISTLLAPLAMGITVAVIEERRGTRDRCFNALRTVEYPVYIIFFTLAGAELDFKIVLSGGVLMLVYIAARSAGKFLAGFAGSLAGGLSPGKAAWFGVGSFPQAGVAVGLALSASADYPEFGATITAVVLASIVFFEAVGPVAAKRALVELGCATPESEVVEEGTVCRERTVMVPVSHHWSAEKLLGVLRATEDESGCPSRFVLVHVVTPGRGYTVAESLARGQIVLDGLAEIARNGGHEVETRIVRSRAAEVALSELAEEIEADLVVLGMPRTSTRRFGGSPLRTSLHRIIDRLTAPVFIIPEGWEPRETGARIGSTTIVVDGQEPESSSDASEPPSDAEPASRS